MYVLDKISLKQFISLKLPLITLLIASTVNAREMNKAKISSVDLRNTMKKSSKTLTIIKLNFTHEQGLKKKLIAFFVFWASSPLTFCLPGATSCSL